MVDATVVEPLSETSPNSAPSAGVTNMKRVLVTGGSGFIGRRLVSRLASAGYRVTAVVRRTMKFGVELEPTVPLEFAREIDWGPLLAGTDIVVHLAEVAHRDASEEAYEQIEGRRTEALARAPIAAGVGKLIFISSIGAQTGSTSGAKPVKRFAHQGLPGVAGLGSQLPLRRKPS
jgi:nucleoside-diphosphate-sugar epimerase